MKVFPTLLLIAAAGCTKVHPSIQQAVDSSAETISVIIYMRQQANLDDATLAAVHQELVDVARVSQEALVADMTAMNGVTRIKSFSVANALALDASDPRVIAELAARLPAESPSGIFLASRGAMTGF